MPDSDSSMDNALLSGLCRMVSMLAVTLTKQGAINREQTILDFERFLENLGQPYDEAATRMWTNYLLDVLRNDPARPPAAPILRFPPRD
jgi:hypothetical protein